MTQPQSPKIRFHAATPDRWRDIETLFGKRGACAGCWCMWWRLGRSAWERTKGEGKQKGLPQPGPHQR